MNGGETQDQWGLDADGWCPQAKQLSNQKLISASCQMRDALLDMLGAVDTPIRRRRAPSQFTDQAIENAKAALRQGGVIKEQ